MLIPFPVAAELPNDIVNKTRGKYLDAYERIAGASIDELKSSVAIEGELLDSQTGKPIAMFADNATETSAVINTALLTTYGTPREIVNQWAQWFVAVLNRKPGQKIDRGPGFKLINTE